MTFEIGRTVGQWTILELIPANRSEGRTQAKYKAQCSCGKTKLVQKAQLDGGHTRSCGHDRNAKSAASFSAIFGRASLPPLK